MKIMVLGAGVIGLQFAYECLPGQQRHNILQMMHLANYSLSVLREMREETGIEYEDKVEYWTGLRPSTPSNVPLIGRTKYPNLFLNTRHGTLGWTTGPGSGKALADLIDQREPEVDFKFLRG